MLERIIQKNSDLGLKARFQHIREARVLGFTVDPFTDINPSELPFSLEDLQYLRYHFEVFSVVSLFGLTADEIRQVERLDAYLDIRDARIAFQERTQATSQVPDPTPVSKNPEGKKESQEENLGDEEENLGDEENRGDNEENLGDEEEKNPGTRKKFLKTRLQMKRNRRMRKIPIRWALQSSTTWKSAWSMSCLPIFSRQRPNQAS